MFPAMNSNMLMSQREENCALNVMYQGKCNRFPIKTVVNHKTYEKKKEGGRKSQACEFDSGR